MSPQRRTSKQPNEAGERLQKVLAAAGVASRRECEQWILDGRVDVDRAVITELGVRVDPSKQEIRVDGSLIKIKPRSYFLLNKPPGIVSTNRDPDGRTRVIDLIQSRDRLFTVGRLDRSSEGLILVTNDGEWANQLAHPRFGVEKTYLATVAGHPAKQQLDQLRKGVFFAEGKAKVVSVHIKKKLREQAVLEIVLNEGRNREIRRLLAKVGHKVLRLKRIALGTIRLGEIPTGAYRELTKQELQSLRRLTKTSSSEKRSPGGKGGASGKSQTGKSQTGKGGASGKPETGKSRGPSKKKSSRAKAAAAPQTKPRAKTRTKLVEAAPSGTIIGGEAEPKSSVKKKSTKRKLAKTRSAKTRSSSKGRSGGSRGKGRTSKKGRG
jgi:23S rRNA pseudouridine2605 synthase